MTIFSASSALIPSRSLHLRICNSASLNVGPQKYGPHGHGVGRVVVVTRRMVPVFALDHDGGAIRFLALVVEGRVNRNKPSETISFWWACSEATSVFRQCQERLERK